MESVIESTPAQPVVGQEIDPSVCLIEAAGSSESPSLIETVLPDDYHQAYSLRLAGVPVEEIATKLKRNRTTIWRWIKAVEEEFADQLEKSPQYNILVVELRRSLDWEEWNRRKAMTAKSERSQAMFAANVSREMDKRRKFLLDTQILNREPTKLRLSIENAYDHDPLAVKPVDGRSREELIGDVIEKLATASRM